MAPHVHVRRLGAFVGEVGPRDAARRIEHETDHKFADRGEPASAGMRDEHPVRAGGGDIDIADVHGDAADRGELGQSREGFRHTGGGAISDDDLATQCRLDQSRRVERTCAFVQGHFA